MDISVLHWVHENLHSITWLNYVMKYVTLLGEDGIACIVLCLILIIIKKTRRCGFAMAFALIFDVVIVNLILKNAVARSRPWTEYAELESYYEQYGIVLPDDYSFPSGHTAVLFCSATVLTMFYRAKAGVPSYIIAVIVAISRIWLCVHYPTDVLAGMLIGIACGVAGYFAFKYSERAFIKYRNKKKSAAEEDDKNEDS
ncbi:MAG: phosphatase PAP2 family protein [Clostridia bacterium]|nr:phosphatase PAP2 family protein [Clostridia bacterium]